MPRFPKTPEPDETTLRDRFTQTIQALDTARATALDHAALLAEAKTRSHARERARAEYEHGAESPETAAAKARAVLYEREADALRSEREKARVEPFDVAADTAVFHGRVLDQRHAPLKKVRVAVVDERGHAIASDDTDGRGYYKIDLRSGAKRKVLAEENLAATISKSPAVRLVATRGEAEIARSLETFEVEPGYAVYRDLIAVRKD